MVGSALEDNAAMILEACHDDRKSLIPHCERAREQMQHHASSNRIAPGRQVNGDWLRRHLAAR
jgi:hypothetical protein